jgi:hypothetical protein
MKDIYADRFLKCTASQGVVRLDFGRVESIDNEKNEISMTPSTRLVLPMDSFSHFVDQVVQLRDKMKSHDTAGVEHDEAVEKSALTKDKKKETDSVH